MIAGSGRFVVVSVLLGVAMAIVCSLTFLPYRALDRRNSIVLEADTNDYVNLLLDSRWRRFFDPTAQASLAWEEQRKVLHHVAYFHVAEGVMRVLTRLAAPAGGIGRRTAIYGINAVLTLINVILVAVLLRRLTPRASIAFVLLFVGSLTTWVFGALPDTWVLSGTFVLLTVLMASSPRLPLSLVSAAIGLFMLNNFTLATATLVLLPRVVGPSGTAASRLRRAVAATAPALVVWLLATQLLATKQPLFHPTEFARATATFQHTLLPEPRSPISPIRWSVAFAQLFVLSIISNQSALNVSASALLHTAANVPFGTIGIVLLLSAYGVAAYRFQREAQTDGLRSLLCSTHAGILLFVLAAYAAGTLGIYVDIILHSPVVVPALVLLLARYVGSETPTTRGLIWALAGSALVNTVFQLAHFRAVLDMIRL